MLPSFVQESNFLCTSLLKVRLCGFGLIIHLQKTGWFGLIIRMFQSDTLFINIIFTILNSCHLVSIRQVLFFFWHLLPQPIQGRHLSPWFHLSLQNICSVSKKKKHNLCNYLMHGETRNIMTSHDKRFAACRLLRWC